METALPRKRHEAGCGNGSRPRLPLCAAWPTVSRPGWIAYTLASCIETGTETETGGKKTREYVTWCPKAASRKAGAPPLTLPGKLSTVIPQTPGIARMTPARIHSHGAEKPRKGEPPKGTKEACPPTEKPRRRSSALVVIVVLVAVRVAPWTNQDVSLTSSPTNMREKPGPAKPASPVPQAWPGLSLQTCTPPPPNWKPHVFLQRRKCPRTTRGCQSALNPSTST